MKIMKLLEERGAYRTCVTKIRLCKVSFSSPEVAILLVCARNREEPEGSQIAQTKRSGPLGTRMARFGLACVADEQSPSMPGLSSSATQARFNPLCAKLYNQYNQLDCDAGKIWSAHSYHSICTGSCVTVEDMPAHRAPSVK